MPEINFDLIVIGGGPGGYVAAIRAAQLGMNTALVEREHLGGICLNWGCIPTKALLRTAEINHLLQHLPEYGFAADNIRFDLPAIVARSRRIAGQLAAGVGYLLKKNEVTVFNAAARLAGPGTVHVARDGDAGHTLTAPHIILATGARARQLPGLDAGEDRVWTYREAMVPNALPASLLVIGSGAIGIEFASFYRNLGTAVTVIELADRILPVEDAEIGAFARKSFEAQGMTILTSATVSALARSPTGVTATIRQGDAERTLEVDRVISAVGIVGNVENLGLDTTKAVVERSHVVIDALCRTAEPGLYAIGDLAGPPWLAHKASHEAVVCVEAIAGLHPHPIDWSVIPGCTYCRPQIASVGYTEARAIEAGYTVRVGRFPFIGNGKAIAMGEPEGLCKTVFDATTGELLGAHMIGPEVTEMIQGYAIARTLESTEQDLIRTIFPHPTVSETMHEAVLDAYGRAVHF